MQEVIDRPESRMSFVNNKNNDLKEDFTKLSLRYDGLKKPEQMESASTSLGIDDEDEKVSVQPNINKILLIKYFLYLIDGRRF